MVAVSILASVCRDRHRWLHQPSLPPWPRVAELSQSLMSSSPRHCRQLSAAASWRGESEGGSRACVDNRYLLGEGAREHPAPLLHPGEMLVRLLHLRVDGVQVALHPVQLLPLLVQHGQGVLTRVLCLCVGGLWSNCCDTTTIVTSSSMLSMFRVEARELSVVAFALAWYLSRSLISAILSSKVNDSLILYYSKHSPDFM